MPPKKRGRKPKPKTDPIDKPPPKKRGRKPKGGKIIPKKKENIMKNKIIEKPNIILHLKCSSNELKTKINNMEYNPELKFPESFNINSNKTQTLQYNEIININNNNLLNSNNNLLNTNDNIHSNVITEDISSTTKNCNMKSIWNKL